MAEADLNPTPPRQWPWRDIAIVCVPAAVLLLMAFGLTFYFVKPAPPRTLVMGTSSPVSPYGVMGRKLADTLSASGVTLQLPITSGVADNLARLRDPHAVMDAGIVQGGMASSAATAPHASPLVSLGSLGIEPLWVFYRSPKVFTRLSELAGLRIGVGSVGSTTHKLSTELLRASGIGPEQANIYEFSPDLAALSLLRGQLDVVFVNSGVDSIAVKPLRHAAGLRLMHFEQAAALTRLYPYLSKVTLPRGALDLAQDFPPQDTDMVASTINLIVRRELHPALMYLLLESAQKLFDAPGLFQDLGDYPSRRGQDMELAEEAQRFYAGQKPFFQRYLPYWLANFVERMLILLIPVLAVLVPVVQYLPKLYDNRIKRRITRWYKLLRQLEHALHQTPPLTPAQRDALSLQLDQIEAGIHGESLPASHSEAFYGLRAAIDLIRDRIARPDTKALAPLRALPLA